MVMKQNYVIGVISDTHGEIPSEKITNQLRDCDLIIHTGDIGRRETLVLLSNIAPTLAVSGNCENPRIAYLAKTLSLKIFRWDIVAVHTIFGVVKEGVNIDYLREFSTIYFPSANVYLFGHTHKRFLGQYTKKGKSKFYVNSGAIYKPFDEVKSIAKVYITPDSINVKFFGIDGELQVKMESVNHE